METKTRAMTVRANASGGMALGRFRAGAGFTITELMIAMTISLFIVGALTVVMLGGSATNRTRERSSEVQSNGRYAMEQVKTDLLHAGFLGISSLFFPDQPLSPPITVANACDATAGQLSRRVWGAQDSNPYRTTCIPDGNYARGDVLVIRGLNPTPVWDLNTAPPVGTFNTPLVYYHSAYEGGQPFKGGSGVTPPDFSGGNKQPPYRDYIVEETVYYVSPYTTSATENPKVPALYRLRLGTGAAMTPELVASGVENLQLSYGVFQTDDTVRYMTADAISTADWDLVRSVQVFLLMRASTPEAGYVNNTIYTMGADTYTVNDNYPRLLLTAVIQLRN